MLAISSFDQGVSMLPGVFFFIVLSFAASFTGMSSHASCSE
jgi:hypothetical protein